MEGSKRARRRAQETRSTPRLGGKAASALEWPRVRRPAPDAEIVAARVLRRLRSAGYLLFSDPAFDSVVAIVVGSPIRGSWWGHPMGGRIYEVAEILEGAPDVLELPLFFQKSTLVHQKNWKAVWAVASSHAGWQSAGLSPAARALLHHVDREGEVRLEEVSSRPLPAGRSIGDVARELERRLLVLGRSVHTPGGRHAKRLTSWRRWGSERGLDGRASGHAVARREIEQRVRSLFPGVPVDRALPWVRRP